MEKKDKITCSFICDRELYLAFKSKVVGKGETVKGELIKHMEEVVKKENEKN